MKLRIIGFTVASVMGLSGTAAAQTDFKTFDEYCSTGTLRTCASIRVWTQWDAVASVTRVKLWVANLQGTLPEDNTDGAPITRVGLTAPKIVGAANLTVTTINGAQTIGQPAGYWQLSNEMFEGPVTFSTTTKSYEGGIQGCSVYPSWSQNYYQTCGQGWVLFSFTTTNQWSASSSDVGWGLATNANNGQYWHACRTEDPTLCAPADPTATPEPVSAALIGTGLAGLAAMRRRRRRARD